MFIDKTGTDTRGSIRENSDTVVVTDRQVGSSRINAAAAALRRQLQLQLLLPPLLMKSKTITPHS